MLPILPPTLQSEVDQGTLDIEKTSVPTFINLYRHLTTQVLDHDGSAIAHNQQYESSGVSQQLKACHLELARNAILLRALSEICQENSKDLALSVEQRELCYIVCSYLASIQTGMVELNDDIEDLMADELDHFHTSLPQVSPALSAHLTQLENTLAKLTEYTTPPLTSTAQPTSNISSSRHTSRVYKSTATTTSAPSSSTLHIETSLTQQAHRLTTTLPALLASLASTLHTLNTAQTTHLTTQIRHLELHTHSTQSRHLTSHATFLATVSTGLALKTQITALQQQKKTYAQPGVRESLDARYAELRREEDDLDERERRLRGLLVEFEAAGEEGVFEKLGKGYRDVEREIEVLREDVGRLEREVEIKGMGDFGRRR